MKNYQRTLTVAANPAAVYAALSTIDGLRSWWTEDCEGSAAAGGTIHFRFGDTSKDMRVERLEAGREVRWLCTRAHIAADFLTRKDEWVGTEVVFHISTAGHGRSRVEFEHIGFVPSFECYQICDSGWQQFLGSLQQYLETGAGAPYAAQSVCGATLLERSKAA